MNFADALEQSVRRPGTKCAVCQILGSLPPKDRDDLTAALATPVEHLGHAQIVRALALLGHKVTSNSLGRHRRGECLDEPR